MSNNTEQLIGYCGLYCGDCFVHSGVIADLSRDLRKELRSARFDRTAEALAEVPMFRVFGSYSECYEVLGAMVKFRCKRACRGGGGNPYCKIRKCCQRKGYTGCWECSDFEGCAKLEELSAVHGAAGVRNLRRIRRSGVKSFVNGKRDWYVKAST